MKKTILIIVLLVTAPIIGAQSLKDLPGACLIGPYLTGTVDKSTPEVTVRWQTIPEQPGEIEFGSTEKLGQKFGDKSGLVHQFKIPNFKEDFFYRVKGPLGYSKIYQYKKPKNQNTTAFLVLSDMQDGEMLPHRRWGDVALSAMAKARESEVSFLVILGDLPEEDYPGYWKLFFDRSGDLLASYPSFVVPGNHDSPQGKGNRGKMNHFQNFFPDPLFQGFRWNQVAWLLLNTEVTTQGLFSEDPDQVDFAKNFLALNQNAPWVLAGFHYPPYHALDRHQDSVELTREFTQYFDGTVDMVFNGHVHNYQRTKPILFEGGVQSTYGRGPGRGPGYIVIPPAGNWPESYSRMGGSDEGADLVAWPVADSKGRFSQTKSEIGFVLVQAQDRSLDIQVWGQGDLELNKTATLHLIDQFSLKK